MRYVIMANGRESRWNHYLGTSKHLIRIDKETLLERTVRLIRSFDDSAQVLIASSHPDHETAGAVRHAPLRADHELDRFCYELIADDTCFLYGDTFYTPQALELIIGADADKETAPLLFFGNEKSIVALKTADGDMLMRLIDELFSQIEAGQRVDAKGWDVYHLYKQDHPQADAFITIQDATQDFNTPQEYMSFLENA